MAMSKYPYIYIGKRLSMHILKRKKQKNFSYATFLLVHNLYPCSNNSLWRIRRFKIKSTISFQLPRVSPALSRFHRIPLLFYSKDPRTQISHNARFALYERVILVQILERGAIHQENHELEKSDSYDRSPFQWKRKKSSCFHVDHGDRSRNWSNGGEILFDSMDFCCKLPKCLVRGTRVQVFSRKYNLPRVLLISLFVIIGTVFKL